jgi:hypothetical protein
MRLLLWCYDVHPVIRPVKFACRPAVTHTFGPACAHHRNVPHRLVRKRTGQHVLHRANFKHEQPRCFSGVHSELPLQTTGIAHLIGDLLEVARADGTRGWHQSLRIVGACMFHQRRLGHDLQ